VSSIPLIFIGSWSGACSDARAIPRALVASERSAEWEAGVLAVETMARAGFDPQALVRYVRRVQYAPSVRDERVPSLTAAIENLPAANCAAAPSDDFATARQEVRRLVEQPVRPEAAPSLVRKKPY
jgi:predicted Zn-dependent protease